jgi:hypothetical protein
LKPISIETLLLIESRLLTSVILYILSSATMVKEPERRIADLPFTDIFPPVACPSIELIGSSFQFKTINLIY